MISEILVKNTATYNSNGVELGDLRTHNFFYGANGSGKTTISRVIANPDKYTDSVIQWKGGSQLEPCVYNRDFIDENFHFYSSEDCDLKGIFTLGEDDHNTVTKIEGNKNKIKECQNKNKINKATLDGDSNNNRGKRQELKKIELDFTDDCWGLKKKYQDDFEQVFKLENVNTKKLPFEKKILEEFTTNQAELCELEVLKDKAKKIFSDDIKRKELLPTPQCEQLLALEQSKILSKIIVGKDDLDISAMIKTLNNSDWIRAGRDYFNENNGNCPFCQQTTDTKFAESLNQYFDETYEKDICAINDLRNKYEKLSNDIVEILMSAITVSSEEDLNRELINSYIETLKSHIIININRIDQKKKKTSTCVTLVSLKDTLDAIDSTLDEANTKIQSHNTIIENFEQEKKTLISNVWRFLVEEIRNDHRDYIKKEKNLTEAISNLEENISKNDICIKKLEEENKTLGGQITDTKKTVTEINKMLNGFGFSGFKLARSYKKGFYLIVRDNGKPVENTLSEGEKTFISFLYFYHLLKGSHDESGDTKDKIVVFDDPVSSLDSEILFIVSTLIKEILEESKGNNGDVKQVFILTHNIYFHKEVTFNDKRRNNHKMKNETFWIVKKLNSISSVEPHDKNPITSSYELLWSEINCDKPSILTIRNTLRRILEYYFKILGGLNTQRLLGKFEGKDKIIFVSLVSWVNAGSHYPDDDLYCSCNENEVEKYLNVFKQIFEQSGQIKHYEMMTTKNGENH